MIYYSYLKSPIGLIKIEADDDFVLQVYYLGNEQEKKSFDNELTLQCKQQLMEYFAGTRKEFYLPLYFGGTAFQNKVWTSLQKINYGEDKTYQDIANAIGNSKAVRAVGGAIHNNPYFIVVPCHRVIGKNGDLVGFACGLEVKKYLLNFEKRAA